MGIVAGAIVAVVGLNVAVVTSSNSQVKVRNMEPVACFKAGGDYVGYHKCQFK